MSDSLFDPKIVLYFRTIREYILVWFGSEFKLDLNLTGSDPNRIGRRARAMVEPVPYSARWLRLRLRERRWRNG